MRNSNLKRSTYRTFTLYVLQDNKGRYLGNSIWTYDIERAIKMKSDTVEKKQKSYPNTEIVEYGIER